MIRFLATAMLLAGLAFSAAAADTSSRDKVLSSRDFAAIRHEVETMRGKKFLHPVPVYVVSKNELRRISEHDLEKDLPGPKLQAYSELLAWLDLVPPNTDLKAVYSDFCAGQVEGFYVSENKEICIPSTYLATTNAPKKQKLKDISLDLDDVVLAHEFTHALEDQYWPVDDPKDTNDAPSTDRGTAHDFVLEGSANREMIDVIPAQFGGGSPRQYFTLWNLIHSAVGEFALNYSLNQSWKAPDAMVAGVPESLSREEAMPYAYGYTFCTDIMRDWGLDGLDYIYGHPPVSSAQVMHPKMAWEWRHFPVQIDLPAALRGGWKQISIDCEGEAGVAVLFGCQFHNLNRGLQLARGWDGDHVALFGGAGGRRLMLWASAWDSSYAAARYVSAFIKEQETAHGAVLIMNYGNVMQWETPGGRFGLVRRDGKRVILMETDNRETLSNAQNYFREVKFTEPPENAARAAVNQPFRRFNPFFSRQTDGDYTVRRTLGGLLSRHDQNSVGHADRYVMGVAGEFRRTRSLNKWEIGGGWLARHISESRRGFSKTTLLPWGILASKCSARLPQSPDKTITRTTILWGLGGSITVDENGTRSVHVLGIPVWTRHALQPGKH